MKKVGVVLLLSFLATASATTTRQCPGFARKLNNDEVSLSNCNSGTCRLKRKTDAKIIMKFTPDRDVKRVITTVNANILDVPFPFIGVDGTNACGNIFLNDEKHTRASCPLKAGQTYIYKNAFKVLEIYPKINLVIHWALTTEKNEVLSCFEVPARIV